MFEIWIKAQEVGSVYFGYLHDVLKLNGLPVKCRSEFFFSRHFKTLALYKQQCLVRVVQILIAERIYIC